MLRKIYNIKLQIKDAIINSIRQKTDDGFKLSQQRCPYRTGYCKRHGSYSNLENGAQIRYTADYTSYLERGTKGGNQDVKGFYRRDGIYVRPFSRYMPAREGIHFIGNSLKESFKELPEDFEYRLRQNGLKVIKSI